MTKKNKRWGRGAAALAILLTACMLINPLAQGAIAMADTPVEEPLPVEDEVDQILQENENAMQELPVEGSEENDNGSEQEIPELVHEEIVEQQQTALPAQELMSDVSESEDVSLDEPDPVEEPVIEPAEEEETVIPDPEPEPDDPAPKGEGSESTDPQLPEEPELPTEEVTAEDPVEEELQEEELQEEDLQEEDLQETELQEEEVEEEPEEEPEEEVETHLSQICDGVIVSVDAELGAFPAETSLQVTRVPVYLQQDVDAAVENERPAEQNVAVSYTFDICILDKDGIELQPVEGKQVKISFKLAEAADNNLTTQIYHVKDEGESLSATPLDVETEGDVATVATDSFSIYTVEFTYGDITYEMDGGGEVDLGQVMEYLGLIGEITSVEVSNPELISAQYENDFWILRSLAPFQTEEWLKVCIGGVEFTVKVTDPQRNPPYPYTGNPPIPGVVMGSDDGTLTANAPASTIQILFDVVNDVSNAVPTIISSDPGFVTIPASQVYFTETGRGNAMDGNGLFVVYDNNAPGALRSTLSSSSDNFFPGELFKFVYPNAAILEDGSFADVVMTYSNLHIALQTNCIVAYAAQTYIASGELIRAGNSYPSPARNQTRNGIQVDLNIRIMQNGQPVTGTFPYAINDIDVWRNGANSFEKLWGADDNYNYSEMISINSGTASDIYVPGPGYKAAIEQYGSGIRVVASQTDNETIYAGLITTVDNTNGGLNITAWSAGSKTAPVRTYLFDGINRRTHTIVSTTGIGGNIQTTANGNQNGALNDGGEVMGPASISVPDGKTMVYTMTPGSGYAINTIDIWDDQSGTPEMFVQHINKDDLQQLANGTIGSISVPLRDGSGKTGTLVYSNGTYLFTFPNNNYDHKIHVTWQTDLSISKTITGTGSDPNLYFPLTLDLSNLEDGSYAVDLSNAEASTNESPAHTNPSSITVSGGAATAVFYLKNGQSVSMMLPVDTSYTVSETNSTEYDASYVATQGGTAGSSVSALSTSAASIVYPNNRVDFANTVKPGALQVTKAVATPGAPAATFTCRLKLSADGNTNEGGTEPYVNTWNLSFADAVMVGDDLWEFTLEAGETASFTGIPNGVMYQIWEQDLPMAWMMTSSSNISGQIVAGTTAEAEIVNSYVTCDLEISKTVDGNMGNKTEEGWQFLLTLKDDSDAAVTGITAPAGVTDWTEIGNGQYSFKLAHGDSITIPDLPRGTKYTVAEQDPAPYKASFSINGSQSQLGNSTGEQILSQDTGVAYTNSLNIVVPTGIHLDLSRVIGFALTVFGVFGLYLQIRYMKKRYWI